MVCGEKLGQDTREQLNLPGRANNLVIDHARGVDPVLHRLEQERMLADFAELHELVRQALHASTRFAVQDVS